MNPVLPTFVQCAVLSSLGSQLTLAALSTNGRFASNNQNYNIR